ncbi:MAG TPA: dihydrofolate reductase [Candidatus Saccharimonadales bacterium]|nr:dihydrofolate reductase [Candidatus Saccharimonadales bacterium]
MHHRLSAIAIISKNRGIGFENKLLFHIPGELPRFKKITSGHPVIMGRKTYESIGRLLPNRTNIIVTRDSSYNVNGAEMAASLEDALEIARKAYGNEEIFVIGGGQLFAEALPIVDRLYLTVVDEEVPANVFFPQYEPLFGKILSEEKMTDWEVPYTFYILEKE